MIWIETALKRKNIKVDESGAVVEQQQRESQLIRRETSLPQRLFFPLSQMSLAETRNRQCQDFLLRHEQGRVSTYRFQWTTNNNSNTNNSSHQKLKAVPNLTRTSQTFFEIL